MAMSGGAGRNSTEVLPCNCVSVQDFEVKSGGAKRGMRQKATIPFSCRTDGVEFQDKLLCGRMKQV